MTLTPNRVALHAGEIASFGDFPATAPAANPVFYRTYSRRIPEGRESWAQVGQRNLEGLRKLGNLNQQELDLLARMQAERAEEGSENAAGALVARRGCWAYQSPRQMGGCIMDLPGERYRCRTRSGWHDRARRPRLHDCACLLRFPPQELYRGLGYVESLVPYAP